MGTQDKGRQLSRTTTGMVQLQELRKKLRCISRFSYPSPWSVWPMTGGNYKWNLKNWDGELLVTQYFMVTSNGRAKENCMCCMGRYSLVKNIVMIYNEIEETTPVYKKDERHFLYLSSAGVWAVSDTVGKRKGHLAQKVDRVGFSILPSKTLPWRYSGTDNDGGARLKEDDNTLKVFPCYR